MSAPSSSTAGCWSATPAVKAHFLDIGAKDYFCSDTTDYYQEGTVFPG